MRPYFFYSTPLALCPYLSGKLERKVATELNGTQATGLHDTLSRAGFRRSHAIAYVPACPECEACIPTRIDVNRFKANRTMRRVIHRNADLIRGFVTPQATDEHYLLFSSYQKNRHGTGDMVQMSSEDFRSMVEDSPINTFLSEFRTADGTLEAACLTDRMDDGLSAVYSYFSDNEPRRSLGIHMVLSLIDYAHTLALPYLYLGYWVAESRKMSYKARFSGLEGYRTGRWQPIR